MSKTRRAEKFYKSQVDVFCRMAAEYERVFSDLETRLKSVPEMEKELNACVEASRPLFELAEFHRNRPHFLVNNLHFQFKREGNLLRYGICPQCGERSCFYNIEKGGDIHCSRIAQCDWSGKPKDYLTFLEG